MFNGIVRSTARMVYINFLLDTKIIFLRVLPLLNAFNVYYVVD